jgi:hypothetical protein
LREPQAIPPRAEKRDNVAPPHCVPTVQHLAKNRLGAFDRFAERAQRAATTLRH